MNALRQAIIDSNLHHKQFHRKGTSNTPESKPLVIQVKTKRGSHVVPVHHMVHNINGTFAVTEGGDMYHYKDMGNGMLKEVC